MTGYALDVGLRYLRSKKRASVSVISIIAISGVALGVAALMAVMSITSGFQREFRDKVLGVNAHVLVMKYGLNFEEYRDVIDRANKMPEVAGSNPFIINEMMLAKGDRLSGVLVKGVDPELMPTVLDLPKQMVKGSFAGLRAPGAAPALRPDGSEPPAPPPPGADNAADLDAYLAELAREDAAHPEEAGSPAAQDAQDAQDVLGQADAAVPLVPSRPKALPPPNTVRVVEPALKVAVPTPDAMEAALAEGDLSALPSDEGEDRLVEDSAPARERDKDESQLPGIVVGVTLAKELEIAVGDRVKIVSPLTGIDPSLLKGRAQAPKSRDFKVIGIFECGFQEYDSKLAVIDLYEAQAFQGQGDTVVGVEMRLKDIDTSADVATRIERDLGGGPYNTMDWRELNHNLFTALEMQKIMLSLVIATIIFVAAFNVVATLIMIVLEKRREIAILKAMGAKDSAVLRIFMVQGAAIGAFGTGIGLAVGGVLCAYLNYFKFPLDPKVYLIDHLPIRTSWTEFLWTVVIAFGICVTATLIPSLWAARMLPAEGVRPQ